MLLVFLFRAVNWRRVVIAGFSDDVSHAFVMPRQKQSASLLLGDGGSAAHP